jgi:hypothetical protein
MPAGNPLISKALQKNAVEKHTAPMREHTEEPYKSRILPTIGEKGYCPIIPLIRHVREMQTLFLTEVLTLIRWS